MCKKFLSVILLSLVLLVPIKKSEAGVLIVTTSTAVAPIVGGSVIILFGALGMSLAGPDPREWYDGFNGIVTIPSTLLLVLEADGSLPQDKLEQELSKKYKFIENAEVIEHLAQIIKQKAASITKGKFVSVTNEEIDSILLPLDLTGYEAEVMAMKMDLE